MFETLFRYTGVLRRHREGPLAADRTAYLHARPGDSLDAAGERLVSKNGILIVEFANQLQRQGKSKLDAVKSAAATRLRPVLMTSVATACRHFPLTLVTGPGVAARKSIGLVLVAGMAMGTAFTLFFVPAIDVLLARDHQKVPAPREEEEEEAPTLSPVKST